MNEKKTKFHLLDWGFLAKVAEVFREGADRPGRKEGDWRKLPSTQETIDGYFDAAMRHLIAGDYAAVAANAQILDYYKNRKNKGAIELTLKGGSGIDWLGTLFKRPTTKDLELEFKFRGKDENENQNVNPWTGTIAVDDRDGERENKNGCDPSGDPPVDENEPTKPDAEEPEVVGPNEQCRCDYCRHLFDPTDDPGNDHLQGELVQVGCEGESEG